MLKATVLTALLLGAGLQQSQQSQQPQQGERHNPSAAAAGAQSFRTYCASCHGPGGKGDGPLAEYLKVPPADLTVLSQKNNGQFPFDAVRRKIDGRENVPSHGSQDMPVWGDAFKTTDTEEQAQQRIEALTHFLWSIQVVSGE